MTSCSTSTGFEELHIDPTVAEAAALAARGEGHASLDEAALFGTDDFRMYCLKIMPCAKRFTHDWVTCNFCHSGEKAKRRDPRFMTYTGIACPFMKKAGSCPHGDKCPYAHNVFEYWLHPTRYRTQLCNDGMNCRRRVCFFAHSTVQLRVPAAKPFVAPEVLATLESGSPSALQNPTPVVAEALRHISNSWQPGTRGAAEFSGPAAEATNNSCLTPQDIEARVIALVGGAVSPEVVQQLRKEAPLGQPSLQGRLAATLQALQSSVAAEGDNQEQLIDVLQGLLHDALLAQQQQQARKQQQQPTRVLQSSSSLRSVPHDGNSTDNSIASGNSHFQSRLANGYLRGSSNGGSSQDSSPHAPSAVGLPSTIGLQQVAAVQKLQQMVGGMGSWSAGAAIEPQGVATGWLRSNGGMLPQLVEHSPVLQQTTANEPLIPMDQLVAPQAISQRNGLHAYFDGQPVDHVVSQSYDARRSLQHDVGGNETMYPRRRSLQVDDTIGASYNGAVLHPTTQSGDMWFEQQVLGGPASGSGQDILAASLANGSGEPTRMGPRTLGNVAHRHQQRARQLLFQQGKVVGGGPAGNGINFQTHWPPQNAGSGMGSLVSHRASLDSVPHQNLYWPHLRPTSLSLDVNCSTHHAKSIANDGISEVSGSTANLARACHTFSDPGLMRRQQSQSLPVDAMVRLHEKDAVATMHLLNGLSLSNMRGWQPAVSSS